MRELSERDKALIVDSIPEADLVGYWPGLQGRGATLLDRSQNANHGTISGAIWKRLPSGLHVLSFGGVDAVVNCGRTTSLNALTGNQTHMAWIKPATLGEGGTGRVIHKGFFGLDVRATAAARWVITVGAVAKNVASASNSVPLGSWTCIFCIFNSVNVLIDTNGTTVTGTATAGPIDNHSTADFLIGDLAQSTNCFDGLIWKGPSWSRALTQAERDHYRLRTTPWFRA